MQEQQQGPFQRLQAEIVELGPWEDTRVQRETYWNPTIKVLGLRHRTPYSTRHTRATEMLMKGCKPAWCARQLGHSVEMFFRVYAKWIDGEDNGAELAKLEEGIRPDFATTRPQKNKTRWGSTGEW